MSTLAGQWAAPEADDWTPTSSGATRSISAPSSWGTGARIGSARITNNTRGTLYVAAGRTGAGPTNYDVLIGPYGSETVPVAAPMLSLEWEGLTGTAGGVAQRVVTVLYPNPAGPSGSGISAPAISAVERTRVTNTTLSGSSHTITPTTIGAVVSARIINPFPYVIELRRNNASGAIVGMVPPFSTQMVTVGAAQLYLTFNPGFGGSFFTTGPIAAFCDVLMYDTEQNPGEPAPWHNYAAGPMGSGAVFMGTGVAGTAAAVGVPETVYTFDEFGVDCLYVIRYMRAEMKVASTAPGAVQATQANLKLEYGWTGVGAARLLGWMDTINQAGVASTQVATWEMHGPLYLYSRGSGGTPYNYITFTPTGIGASVNAIRTDFTVSGWRVVL